MSDSDFVDYVKICCRSGKGGAGSMHFHRDKKTTKGGPDGGDGGRGGHIILRGNRNHWTLLHVKYRKHVMAEPGKNGTGGLKTGAQGNDVYIDVPLGTVAKNAETGNFIFEITEHGEEKILVQGGRGGLGNNHFKTSTNQSPHYAQPGEPGIEEWIILELKVLADVGLVGFPNAGKSTLLSVVSAAKPDIADYPFTTLVPNLGIVKYRDYHSFVMADIPGIIENAHKGKGIGHRFLRHIERNSLLLFMISCDADNISNEFNILKNELAMFNPDLMTKPCILAITKCDMLDNEMLSQLKELCPNDISTVYISSLTGQGISELKDVIWSKINQ